MYSFLLSILALILGYIVYGAFVDRMFGPDPNRPTPALTKADGVDFIRMPSWRVFMVQCRCRARLHGGHDVRQERRRGGAGTGG